MFLLFKLYKTIAFKATMPSCKLQEDRKLEKNNRVETSLETKENQISMLITVMHNHHNTAKRVSWHAKIWKWERKIFVQSNWWFACIAGLFHVICCFSFLRYSYAGNSRIPQTVLTERWCFSSVILGRMHNRSYGSAELVVLTQTLYMC